MNISAYSFRIQSLLRDVKNILIVLKSQPNTDELAAATALYLSLTQRGKQVLLASPEKVTVQQGNLVGVDKIISDLGKGGKNLIVSFPYTEGAVEKVSYTIENNRFNLVIEPKEHAQLLNKDEVEFSYGGTGAPTYDVIFTLGVTNYDGLGSFTLTHKKLFIEKTTIVIDNKPSPNREFGKMQIINPQGGSLSEIIAMLLSRMNMPMDMDICANLLTGIKDKTANFTQNVQADTFEAAAICTRRLNSPQTDYPDPFTAGVNPASVPPYQDVKNSQETPPDWLKPKIFRSSNQNVLVNQQNKGGLL